MPADLLTSLTNGPSSQSVSGSLSGAIGPVRWRYVPADASDESASSPLSPGERTLLESFRSPLRRSDWLRGRAAAKRLLVDAGLVDASALARIEIVTRDDRGRGIPPEARLDGASIPVALSVSHTAHGALVACATESGLRVGVDLVSPSEVNPEALSLWLTAEERRQIDRARAVDVARMWAAKEAVYKAACIDESFAPLKVEVLPNGNDWTGTYFGVRLDALRLLAWEIDGQIAALAMLPRRREYDCPPEPESSGREPAPRPEPRAVRVIKLPQADKRTLNGTRAAVDSR